MPAFSTFGCSAFTLRANAADAGDQRSQRATSPLPGALRPRTAAAPLGEPRLTLPVELWRHVASYLDVNDALRLRQCSGYCFDVVAESHRAAFTARLRQAVVDPNPRRPRPPVAALEPLLADAREVRCPIEPLTYDRYGSDALDDVLQQNLAALLTYSPNATSVELPLGTPVLTRFAQRPLRLPPAANALVLNQLCCPSRARGNTSLDLPPFFFANADRDVTTLVVARSACRALSAQRQLELPLFPWALRRLELYDVALNDVDFGRLLRANFDELDTLVLAEAPDAQRHCDPLGTSVDSGQLKDLCAVAFGKLRRLELFGEFSPTDLLTFTRRPWLSLEVLRLRGDQLTNDDAGRLAGLVADKLGRLTVEGPFDLAALASLLHPRHAPLRELDVFFTQSSRGWRRRLVPPPGQVAAAFGPSPVRYLRLAQKGDLLPGDAEQLARVLAPAAPMLCELEVHTCRAERGGQVRRALPRDLGEMGLGTQAGATTLHLTYCDGFGSAD